MSFDSEFLTTLGNTGKCCFCGDECDWQTQSCARCARSGETVLFEDRMLIESIAEGDNESQTSTVIRGEVDKNVFRKKILEVSEKAIQDILKDPDSQFNQILEKSLEAAREGETELHFELQDEKILSSLTIVLLLQNGIDISGRGPFVDIKWSSLLNDEYNKGTFSK